MAHQSHVITATHLVPVSEPEQCRSFLNREDAPGKSLPISHDQLWVCYHVTLFFHIDGCLRPFHCKAVPHLGTHALQVYKERSCFFHSSLCADQLISLLLV